jgi:hypothetical protein
MVKMSLPLIEHQSTSTQKGVKVHHPLLNLGTKLRRVLSFTVWLNYPQGKNPYSLERR